MGDANNIGMSYGEVMMSDHNVWRNEWRQQWFRGAFTDTEGNEWILTLEDVTGHHQETMLRLYPKRQSNSLKIDKTELRCAVQGSGSTRATTFLASNGTRVILSWGTDPDSGLLDCRIWLPGQQRELIVAETDLPARKRCRLLIEQLPDDGLAEAEETLRDMYKFYTDPFPTSNESEPKVIGRVKGEYVPVEPVTES